MDIIEQIADIYKKKWEALGSWKKANMVFGWNGAAFRDIRKSPAPLTEELIQGLNEAGYTIALIPNEKKQSDHKVEGMNETSRKADEKGLSYGKYVLKYEPKL